MAAHMLLQRCRLCKTFIADITHMRLIAAMFLYIKGISDFSSAKIYTYLYMPHDLLLAGECVITMSITTFPVAFIDTPPMTDMYLSNMRSKFVFTDECLITAFPLANAPRSWRRLSHVVFHRRRYRRDGGALWESLILVNE